MTVHKKHPADTSAFIKTTADKKAMAGKEAKPEGTKTEPVIVSDVVTETTESIEVVEEVPVSQVPAADPLSDFKEKMIEEELPVSDKSQQKNYMWPILLVFIITILLLTGVFLYRNGINTNDKVNVVTLSSSPTITPEPTKAIDLAKYEIEIQNGGGVSGEASRQEANLAAEGFTISSIGNADNSDYTDTIIKAKKEVDKDFIAKLKSVLSNSFTVGETESLSEDTSVPIVIIIGTKK